MQTRSGLAHQCVAPGDRKRPNLSLGPPGIVQLAKLADDRDG